MSVTYVNASACTTGKISWFQIFGMGYIWWFVIWMIGWVLLFSFLSTVQSPLATTLLKWEGIGLVCVFLFVGVILYRFGAAYWRRRRASQAQASPYSKTMHAIARDLKELGSSLDQAAGYPRLRRKVSVGVWTSLAIGFYSSAILLSELSRDRFWALPKGVILAPAIIAVLCAWRAVRLWRPRNRELKQVAASWGYFWSGALAPILAYVASAVLLGLIATMAAMFLSLFDITREAKLDLAVAGIFVAIIVVIWAVARGLRTAGKWFARSKSLALPRAQDLRKWDPRRPIVLLRSFADDRSLVENTKKSKWDRPGAARLERVVTRRVRQFGPFIAIGQPGAPPEAGAARDYYGGEEWRRVVVEWMDEALLIVLIAGGTAGLEWEIETLVERGHAKKLLILFPPGPDRHARWEFVCSRLSRTPWYGAMRSIDPHWALAVHLSSDDLVAIRGEGQTVGDFEVAVDLGVYGMFCADRTVHQRGVRL